MVSKHLHGDRSAPALGQPAAAETFGRQQNPTGMQIASPRPANQWATIQEWKQADHKLSTFGGKARPSSIAVAGNELRLFVESRPTIQAMVADIDRAQTRVWVESYLFANDAAGKMVAAALCRQAQAGRDVRLLYDAIGSQGTSASIFNQLIAAGVKVHAFHSFLYALRRLSFFATLNRRNHRKLLVVDDSVGYFGGDEHRRNRHSRRRRPQARPGRYRRVARCPCADQRPAGY